MHSEVKDMKRMLTTLAALAAAVCLLLPACACAQEALVENGNESGTKAGMR